MRGAAECARKRVHPVRRQQRLVCVSRVPQAAREPMLLRILEHERDVTALLTAKSTRGLSERGKVSAQRTRTADAIPDRNSSLTVCGHGPRAAADLADKLSPALEAQWLTQPWAGRGDDVVRCRFTTRFVHVASRYSWSAGFAHLSWKASSPPPARPRAPTVQGTAF